MPRMSRSLKVPPYRLHKHSGQAVVTLGGRDRYLGVHGTPESHAAYNRVLAEWLASGRQSRPDPGQGLTIKAVLAAYWTHASAYYAHDGRPTSQVDRVKRSLRPALELYGDKPVSSFGALALKTVRHAMVRKGWCRRVINQRIGCLVRAFKWAAAEELVPSETWLALKAVEGLRAGRTEARESPPVAPAREADVEAAKPFLLPVLRDVIELQVLTAMRPGEALIVRPCDLDRSGPVWIFSPPAHKMAYRGFKKVILIGPRARTLLTPYLDKAESPESYLFSPRLAVAGRLAELGRTARFGTGRVPGDRYLVTSYSHAVRIAVDKADAALRRSAIAAGMTEAEAEAKTFVARWHPHQLRHNSATRLVAEFGWEVARIILGHRHIDTTRLYAEEDLRKAAEAIAKVG